MGNHISGFGIQSPDYAGGYITAGGDDLLDILLVEPHTLMGTALQGIGAEQNPAGGITDHRVRFRDLTGHVQIQQKGLIVQLSCHAVSGGQIGDDGGILLHTGNSGICQTSYSDEQLAFLLRLVYHICEDRSISSDKIRYLINQCAGWFNPLLILFRRAGDVTECTGIDRVITKEFTPEKKAEYLETLESLASEQPSSLHYFRLVGGEAEIALRREQVNTTVQKDIVMTIACFALVIALLFGASFLIQPPNVYPVNEESVFSVLGEDPKKLHGDRRSIDLCSTEEDGLLYGTPYFKAYSAKNDQRICFHYPPDAAPELLESSAQRILDALTERLGPPDGKRDTDASLEVSGALINEIDQQMNLLLEAAGYTPPEEDPSQVNLLIRHQWSVKNTNGESCIVILRIQPGGAYWNEETRGGLLIEIELQ